MIKCRASENREKRAASLEKVIAVLNFVVARHAAEATK